MIGVQKMELTHASVREAIEIYLQSHFGPAVAISLKKWAVVQPGTYGDAEPRVSVEFEQIQKPEAT
jgi:hypothetical protein